MRARLTKLLGGLAAVAALAVGGSALAGAANSPSPAPAIPAVSVPTDTTQQGDQTAPDPAGAADESGAESPATESATESSSEAGPSDGPGGHADAPGNPNADNQFQGEQ